MQVKRLTNTAKLPTKAYPGDAGYDLFADISDFIELYPGKKTLISTGCSFAIPEGYYGRIADRSSVAWKHGCHVLAGVIDSLYRDEVKIVLINFSDSVFTINPGDKIAQLIVTKIYTGDLVEVNELNNTERGKGGFGSSGNK